MAKLLFKLRNVPEDELDDVLALLEENRIDFYETEPGNWGISLPALWIQDDSQFDAARALIEQYQAQRALRAREEYINLVQEGQADTWLDRFRRQPLRVVAYLALIALVLYLSTSTFFF